MSHTSMVSSKMEMQLDFLSKELELEKERRSKLQQQVEELSNIISQQKDESQKEFS